MAAALRLLLLTLLVCLGAAPARAAPSPEEAAQARDHFQRGQVHYDLKEYAAALEQFKSSYRYVQDPKMLYNIAQCHNFLGQSDEALGFYRNYLRRSPEASNRNAVERKIQELERKVAAAPKPPTPASPADLAPPPGGAAVQPPPLAPAAGRGVPAPVAAAGREPGAGAPPFSPPSPAAGPAQVDMSAPPAAPAESPPLWTRWWFWTGIGAVVAAGVVTGVAVGRRGQTGDCMGNLPCLKVGGQ